MHHTAGRKKKYKNPDTRAMEEYVERLQPPILPEYLKGDEEDGPCGSEEEKEAKRLHATSTTPRSEREAQIQMTMIGSWALPQRNPLKWD